MVDLDSSCEFEVYDQIVNKAMNYLYNRAEIVDNKWNPNVLSNNDFAHSIEFEYNDKKYSITYGERNNVEFISFCEFYKNSLDVRSPKELWNAEYNGIPIRKILENMSNASIWIF